MAKLVAPMCPFSRRHQEVEGEKHVDVLLSKDVEDHVEGTGGNEGEHHGVLLRPLRKLQYES